MDFVHKQSENVLTKYVLGARVDSELGILQIFIFLPRILQSPASAIHLPPFAQGEKTRPGVTASDMKKQNRDGVSILNLWPYQPQTENVKEKPASALMWFFFL